MAKPAHNRSAMHPIPTVRPLSEREQAFVIALMTEPSGAHAALAAGFSPSGSMNTAAVAAHRLLRRPHVAAAVASAREAHRRAFDEALKQRTRAWITATFGEGIARSIS
jgi:phage terminase small subunit